MRPIANYSASEIYNYIVSNTTIKPDEYVCIVAGRGGPTGKSWITSRLNTKGYTAVEVTEPLLVSGAVSFNDNQNHLVIDDFRKSVVIILNKILDNYDLHSGCFRKKEA